MSRRVGPGAASCRIAAPPRATHSRMITMSLRRDWMVVMAPSLAIRPGARRAAGACFAGNGAGPAWGHASRLAVPALHTVLLHEAGTSHRAVARRRAAGAAGRPSRQRPKGFAARRYDAAVDRLPTALHPRGDGRQRGTRDAGHFAVVGVARAPASARSRRFSSSVLHDAGCQRGRPAVAFGARGIARGRTGVLHGRRRGPARSAGRAHGARQRPIARPAPRSGRPAAAGIAAPPGAAARRSRH